MTAILLILVPNWCGSTRCPYQCFAIYRQKNLLSWPTLTGYQNDKNSHQTSRQIHTLRSVLYIPKYFLTWSIFLLAVITMAIITRCWQRICTGACFDSLVSWTQSFAPTTPFWPAWPSSCKNLSFYCREYFLIWERANKIKTIFYIKTHDPKIQIVWWLSEHKDNYVWSIKCTFLFTE